MKVKAVQRLANGALKVVDIEVSDEEWDKMFGSHGRSQSVRHILETIDGLDCDDRFKDFLRLRVGVVPDEPRVMNTALCDRWRPHKLAFRSCTPEALCDSDIDLGLRTAIRNINESLWVASEWCCAGHACEINVAKNKRTHCYLSLIVEEHNLGRLLTFIQKVRHGRDDLDIAISADALDDCWAQREADPTHGCHRLVLRFSASSFENVLKWRRFCRSLGRLLKQSAGLF